jgi:SET domain-containing protein
MFLEISPSLYIFDSPGKGRGVFTRDELHPMQTIETSSVLVMNAEARKLLDQTALHDYIFEWGADSNECCVAWGYISMYNHSYEANCEYFMDFENKMVSIITIRKVFPGEELTINYNGDWNDPKPIWFDVV